MIGARTVPVIRVDYTELRRRVAVAKASGDRGRVEAVRVMASAFTDFVYEIAPKDTNRYINGWIAAARQIHATQRPLLPIRDSRVGKMIEEILIRQLETLERRITAKKKTLDAWYYSRGRTGPWLRKEEGRIHKLERQRDRAAEELAKFYGATGVVAFDLFTDRAKRRATVRDKIYGGSGAIITAGTRAFTRLHNLEPHASFVERRARVMARALGVLRQVGAKRASRKYLETQAAAGGLRLDTGATSGRRMLPETLN